MDKVEVTSMSSRGQVVTPLDIREQLGLREGEKFVVIGEADIVVLKKISMPSFSNFDKLIEKTQKLAKEKGITLDKLERAISRARK